MKLWQERFLGLRSFPEDLSDFEVRYFFTFTPEQIVRIRHRRRDELHQLAFALHLGFLRMTYAPLSGVERLPRKVLVHLSEHLGLPVPDVAALRALYHRANTRTDHLSAAFEILGLAPFTERRQRVLVGRLRREATCAASKGALVRFARRWLVDHGFLVPLTSALEDLAHDAFQHAETELFALIDDQVPSDTRRLWLDAVQQPYAPRSTALEWLKRPPKKRSRTSLRNELQKILCLLDLGVDQLDFSEVSTERLREYARKIRGTRPSRFLALAEPARSYKLVCYLYVQLLETTDVALLMAEMLAQPVWREAREQARAELEETVEGLRRCVRDVRDVVEDESIPEGDVRGRVRSVLPERDEDAFPTQAARMRWLITGRRDRTVRDLLRELLKLSIEGEEGNPVLAAMATLRGLHDRRAGGLPRSVDIAFAPAWEPILVGKDRRRALRGFEAAVLEEIRQGLKNSSLWVRHSRAYRRREELLIPPERWEAERNQHYEGLSAPKDGQVLLDRTVAALEAGLERVAEAVRSGELEVDHRGVHLRRDERQEVQPETLALEARIFREIPPVQLPDLMVEIDRETGFSWILLGGAPRSREEILGLYAAMLALGTAKTQAEVRLMIPGISEDAIAAGIAVLQDPEPLRKSNDAVFEFLLRHEVADIWGKGCLASSDSMLLEASKHLWNARMDPRRRHPSMGIYGHVSDTWGIFYDLPLMPSERQAGAAIEGIVRQGTSVDPEKIAVDTHGQTAPAMAIAKILGFDLCPRLRNLRHRRLVVPRGMSVPDELLGIADRTVRTDLILEHWDQLVRIAASIQAGTSTAVLIFARFGSAARGDPLHRAATELGNLLRAVYLCDYFTNPVFRIEIRRILYHGESVHTLQRGIHYGSLATKRGRTTDELVAISGSLTLLSNLVMAWVTSHIQTVLDSWARRGRHEPLAYLRHVAPVRFEDINLNGTFHFPIEQHASRLLKPRGPFDGD